MQASPSLNALNLNYNFNYQQHGRFGNRSPWIPALLKRSCIYNPLFDAQLAPVTHLVVQGIVLHPISDSAGQYVGESGIAQTINAGLLSNTAVKRIAGNSSALSAIGTSVLMMLACYAPRLTIDSDSDDGSQDRSPHLTDSDLSDFVAGSWQHFIIVDELAREL